MRAITIYYILDVDDNRSYEVSDDFQIIHDNGLILFIDECNNISKKL